MPTITGDRPYTIDRVTVASGAVTDVDLPTWARTVLVVNSDAADDLVIMDPATTGSYTPGTGKYVTLTPGQSMTLPVTPGRGRTPSPHVVLGTAGSVVAEIVVIE